MTNEEEAAAHAAKVAAYATGDYVDNYAATVAYDGADAWIKRYEELTNDK